MITDHKCRTLRVVTEACDRIFRDQPDVWILSGLLGTSYETGGSRDRKIGLDSLEKSSFSKALIRQVRMGVNGNLENALREKLPLQHIQANKGNGRYRPDIEIGVIGEASHTLIEVKSVYDFTLGKYYSGRTGIPKDRMKLLEYRQSLPEACLFLIVTFLQMSGFDYPAGSSYPAKDADGIIRWTSHRERSAYVVCSTIAEQFAETVKYIGMPMWPRGGNPKVFSLPLPSMELCANITEWMGQNFQADDRTWRFDTRKQLDDAAIGYAVWQF